ncbi:Heavy metal-associated isoprenylated plant protein 46 [Euphorbia peplus]|nr:Heavy metal-associated isoprenylated plant protein 46 [Euphorbia peplus]
MKQKIVVKVSLNGQKSRSKALKIAVGISGVESAGLGGNDKSQIEIVGDGVDAVQLTTLLRKKVGYTEIVSISAVGEKKAEEKKPEEASKVQQIAWPCTYNYSVPQTIAVHDPYYYRADPTPCSIM